MDDDVCPTCGRDRQGGWSLRRGRINMRLRNRRGRVRATIRQTDSWKRVPNRVFVGWVDGVPQFEVRGTRRVPWTSDVVGSVRMSKWRVSPSTGSPQHTPTSSHIMCVDRWHENDPVRPVEPPVVTPRGRTIDPATARVCARERYLAKRARQSKARR